MTARVLFSAYSIFAAISGLAFLFVPSQAMRLYGVGQLDAVATSLARGAGALLVSLAVMYWTARTADASKARDGLLLGLIAVNVLSVVLAIGAGFGGGANWVVWAEAGLFALVTIAALFVTRRAWSTHVQDRESSVVT